MDGHAADDGVIVREHSRHRVQETLFRNRPRPQRGDDCKPDVVYEYGYSQGYRVNVQLRPGERLTRNWFNKGLHVNMDGAGGTPGCLGKRAGMGYQRRLGDIAPGRVGNGLREYDVPLSDGTFRTGALAVENLACTSDDQQSFDKQPRSTTSSPQPSQNTKTKCSGLAVEKEEALKQ